MHDEDLLCVQAVQLIDTSFLPFWYHPSPIKRLESDGTPMSLYQNGVACAVHK